VAQFNLKESTTGNKINNADNNSWSISVESLSVEIEFGNLSSNIVDNHSIIDHTVVDNGQDLSNNNII